MKKLLLCTIIVVVWAIIIAFSSSETTIETEIAPIPKPTIEEIIRSKAIEHDIDPELFVRISRCESGLKVESKNKISTASGIFQFLDSTFFRYAKAYELSTANKNDPYIQAELAAKMIRDKGLSHWSESSSCWQD